MRRHLPMEGHVAAATAAQGARAAGADAGAPGQATDRVTVVVVNWNGRDHLARCLPAIASQAHPAEQVIVVDNGSTDGSLDWLRTEWPLVDAVALGANLGFAAANNRGIEAASTPWIALLNNDTVPGPEWLAASLGAAAGDPRVGSVASRMVFLDRPEMINSAGIAVDPAGIAWDRLGGAPFALGDRPCAVFGACAGAALFRLAALRDAQESLPSGRAEILDERYFMYLEDVDLAWRLQLRGWRSVYAPDAVVRHQGSGTSGEGSSFKNWLLARNKVWTLLKDYPTAPLVRHAPVVAVYDLASAPYRLLAQRQTAALRGRLAAVRDLRVVLARRRAIQARRTADWSSIRSAMADLESPWAVRRRYRHLRAPRAGAPGDDGR